MATPAVNSLLNFLPPCKRGNRTIWQISNISIASLAIADICATKKHPAVVVTHESKVNAYIQALQFFVGKDTEVLEFPGWETLPYECLPQNREIISTRLKAFVALQSSQPVVVVALPTILHKMAAPQYLRSRTFVLHKGQKFVRDALRQQLIASGYVKVSNVYSPGEFSVRGSLIDFFPMGENQPVRIDFFGDEISEIRFFDSSTQCSTNAIESLELLPASEIPSDDSLRTAFIDNWNTRFTGNSRRSPIYSDVKAGVLPAGIEYYLSLYFDDMASFFDYLPENTVVVADSELSASASAHWQEVNNRYDLLRHDTSSPILPPEDIFFRVEEILSLMRKQRLVQIQKKNSTQAQLPDVHVDSRQKNPLARFAQVCQEYPLPILVCCDGGGRREILADLLKDQNMEFAFCDSWQQFVQTKPELGLCLTPLTVGFAIEQMCLVLTESDLYGETPARQISRDQQKNSDYIIQNLVELSSGQPVVHIHHGIGLYKGLETISFENCEQELVLLEYANNDKLYVPITELHCISRYQGLQHDTVTLDKLGSDQWQKRKKRAEQKAYDAAINLLEIQARREATAGIRFNQPAQDYHTFSSQFPFVETPDQTRAIEEITADMCSSRRMDRLICGDVGFGKTEVAMRAAFIAICSGKQVVLLSPTTLLAQQHYTSFCNRFYQWPVKVDMLSSFRSKAHRERAWHSFEQGTTDILIGTHALLFKKHQMPKLGLLIIDEEHRFGVRQKEHFKTLRSQVDILALTATPIPRTLNFAMNGLRDLTVIATAPNNRLAIRTIIRQNSDTLVREAVLRELMRGGQVFIIHNRVKTIEHRLEELTKLLPEARIGIAHGQMQKRELEKTMNQFYHRQFTVLLCTSIIETGIDIPTANTIIIERADKFGLAQLHQLRGRVGRSHHQAYAYLLIPEYLSKDAQQRIEAIGSTNTLGAGFTLAMRDMEIRGAGELLGEEQSGEMEKIGFELYLSMLKQATNSLRKGKLPSTVTPQEVSIDLGVSALIPADYLPDVHSRLVLYRRIVSAQDEATLRSLKSEVIDRFGEIPQQLHNLFTCTRIQNKAKQMRVKKLTFSDKGGSITFAENTTVNPSTVLALIRQEPQTYSFKNRNTLRINRQSKDAETRFQLVNAVFSLLATNYSDEETVVSADASR